VELGPLVRALGRADLPLLALAILLYVVAQAPRALAWSILAGPAHPLPLWRALRLFLGGNLANLVLPMRGGEVARVWILATRGGLGAGRAAAVVVVERTVDLFVVLGTAAAAMLVVGLPEWAGQGVWKLAAAGTVAFGGLAALVVFRRRLAAIVARLEGGGRFRRFARALLARLAEAGQLLRARSALGAVLALVLSWALVLVGLEIRLRALGIELAPGGVLVVLAVQNIASSLPVVPAGIGLFEYATMLCLERLGVAASVGLAFAAASHGLTIALVALMGAIALAVDSIVRRREAAGAAADRGA
jgi:hypothetical protein